jgi:hypothetical protein
VVPESSLGLRWKSTGFEREGYRFLAFASMDSVRNRSLGAVALRLVGDAREEHFEGFYFRPGDPAATYPLLSAYPARASHDELAVQTSEIYAQALGNTSAALPNEFLPVLAGTGNPATTEGKRKLVEQIKRMKRRVVLAVGDSASDMALWDAAVL